MRTISRGAREWDLAAIQPGTTSRIIFHNWLLPLALGGRHSLYTRTDTQASPTSVMGNGISSIPITGIRWSASISVGLASNSRSDASSSNGPNLSHLPRWPQAMCRKWEAGIYRDGCNSKEETRTNIENCSKVLRNPKEWQIHTRSTLRTL